MTATPTTTPLTHLDESRMHDGITTWYADGRGGAEWVITWFPTTGNIAAWKTRTKSRAGHRSTAQGLDAARVEACRIATLITFHGRDLPELAAALGRHHRQAGLAPYGDMQDEGSALLMNDLGQTEATSDDNYPERLAACDAYEDALTSAGDEG
jgi:hypothetical protein